MNIDASRMIMKIFVFYIFRKSNQTKDLGIAH